MTKTYTGHCHCGAVRFEVTADIDHVRVCDCSICFMRGGLMFRVPADALHLLTPFADMTVYRWGSMTAADYFCPTCGILPFRKPGQPTAAERAAGVKPFDGWTVNTRCLDEFDPSSVPIKYIHGRDLELEA